MRVVVSDPDVDLAVASSILDIATAELVFQRDGWSGDDVAAIVVSPDNNVGVEDLQRCVNLKIVVTLSTGVNNIDVEACERRGVTVWHPTDYCSDEVADSTIATLLGLIRGTVFLDRSVRAGQWHFAATGQLGRIDETRLGVIGFGTIGQKVAARARALDIPVRAFDPALPDDKASSSLPGVTFTNLDELLESSNAVTVHVPLLDSTRNLISAARLAQMARGSLLINLARGGIVDMEALLNSLTSGHLAGAAVDVLEHEPPSAGHPSPRHPRLIVTPHAGWYSERSSRFLFQQPFHVIRDVLLQGV